MKQRRFIGYDLNGYRDMAARSWLIKPGAEEELEGTFVVSGGLNGAVVVVNEAGSERLVGGAQARLAPHGRGAGWGAVGAPERRTKTSSLVRAPDFDNDKLAVALHALGGGADVAIVSVDDVPAVGEPQQDAWLRALRTIRNRRSLHIWRPVLAVLSAIADGFLDETSKIGIICHHESGFSTQRLVIRGVQVRAPERRMPGILHECGLGYGGITARARDLVDGNLAGQTRQEDAAHLAMPVRMALGVAPVPELHRSWNGAWTIVPRLSGTALIDQELPSTIRDELAGVDTIILETLAEGPIRESLEAIVTSSLGRAPLTLATDAVAQGALVAARRLFTGDPVYFDFLPQISTIVQDIRGPKSFNLIPKNATLPAGKTYRSAEPAKLGLQAGQAQISVYLKKDLDDRPRKAVLELPNVSPTVEEISCLVEQAPAQGRARILLESDLFQGPMKIDWDKAEEVDEDWDTLLESLETPKPTIPNRLILPATRHLWEDQPRRTGLLTLLKEAHSSSEPNWKLLADKLSSREDGAYCFSSDGDHPDGTSLEDMQLLSEIQARAVAHTLARVDGRILQSDNHALRFLTWLFRRCDQILVPAMLDALEADIGRHPFTFHHANRRLLYQGLGRVLSQGAPIRRVFDHLLAIPEKRWTSLNHVSCAAFLLSRTDEAPNLLTRNEVEKLARICVTILKDGVRREQTNTIHYPPFLMVGLLRWRSVDNWALVAGSDPIANVMLEAVEYALPRLERQSENRSNLRKLHRALEDVAEELRGEGRNPDLLLDFASI